MITLNVFNNGIIESCCNLIFDDKTTKKQRKEAVSRLDSEICKANDIVQISNSQMHKIRYQIYGMYLRRIDQMKQAI